MLRQNIQRRAGNARWGLIALLLGLPLPLVLLAALFMGGCGH
jgi:hypothetical protein